MNNNEFGLFIDQLRESRNLTRAQLVEDIISLRHYYRFIKGETTINSDVLMKFLEKLELSKANLLSDFNTSTDQLYKTLIIIYRKIYVNDLKEANELLNSIEYTEISSSFNRKFYRFIDLLMQVKQNKISYQKASEQLITLINYPEVLNKEVLTFIEKSAMIYLVNHLTSKKDYRIANFFYKIVQNEINYGVEVDQNTIPFRIITAKCLGIIDEHEKALKLLKNAEQQFIVADNFIPMVNSYYYRAIAERKHYNDDRFRKSLQKMFGLVNISNNKKIKDSYNELIKRKFNLLEIDLIDYK